jgi:hypothetical protein
MVGLAHAGWAEPQVMASRTCRKDSDARHPKRRYRVEWKGKTILRKLLLQRDARRQAQSTKKVAYSSDSVREPTLCLHGMSKPSDQKAGFKNKNNLECSRRNVLETVR